MSKKSEETCGVDALPEMTAETISEQGSSKRKEATNLRPPLNPGWTRWTDHAVHHLVPQAVTAIALLATRRPRITLCSIALFSLALAGVGYSTNFKLDVDQFEAYAPYGVRPRSHRDWIAEESGFPPDDIFFVQLVHTDGDNVVGMEGIKRAFEGYQVVYGLDGYHSLCAQSTYKYNNQNTCQVSSVLRFWDYNQTLFEETVQLDDDVIAALLKETYPDGTPVDRGSILGNSQTTTRADGTQVITAQSFVTAFFFPDIEEETMSFEEMALEATFPVRDSWNENGDQQPFRLEVTSEISYALEFTRAIEQDLPLVPLAFLIMSLFTCIIFFRRHAIQSRTLLGLGAVVTIVCSLLAGKILFRFAFATPLFHCDSNCLLRHL